MISYRFKRRAFLTAVSGGVGLKIMLRNMEAAAQTTKSPPRLMLTHWPVGIVAGQNDALFAATSGSIGGSMGMQPFADNNLGADMTVIKGISSPNGAGGSHEGGMPALMTGVACPGTRSGEQEPDDGYAGGPSFEQVMLAVAGTPLKAPGASFSYINLGCDTRTDFGEVSTKCMSYGTGKQSVPALSGSGQENVPLPANLSPLNVYNTLFANFAFSTSPPDPGFSAAAPPAEPMLNNLASRRSVLDFAKTEIDLLRQMAPGEARMKLDNHFEAIKQMEDGVIASIAGGQQCAGTGGTGGNMGMGGIGGMGGSVGGGAGGSVGGGAGGRGGTTGGAGRGGTGGGAGGRGGTTGAAGTSGAAGTTGAGGTGGGPPGCKPSMVAPANVMGIPEPRASGYGNNYGDPTHVPGTNTVVPEDATNLATVGKAHMAVMKAVFICDVLRCGTLLWAPGTNHVGFKGLFPGSTTSVYQHHPQSHKIDTGATIASGTLSSLNTSAQFLFAVQQWFFKQVAEGLKDWKNSYDGFGNSLLDYTVVPYVTEVRATSHERSSMPAMIIGGKGLGFAHNKYVGGVNVNYTCNQFWGLVGPAVGHTSTAAPFAAPSSAFAGLWTKPA